MAAEDNDGWELRQKFTNTTRGARRKMGLVSRRQENIELQSIPAGTLKKLKVSNQALLERLCREELEVVALMHEEFKDNVGFESLAMSVQSVCQDLIRARGMLRFCCQLVLEVMRYKSATVEEDNAMWHAITHQSLTIIAMTKSVFEKAVEYFGYLSRLRDSVIYGMKTQRGDNAVSPEKSLAPLKEDIKDFSEFSHQCCEDLTRLFHECMKGVDCLENIMGHNSWTLTQLRKEHEEKLAWLSHRRFELSQKREEVSAEYVEQLKKLQPELMELERQVARGISKKTVCQAKLSHSEKKVQNMQEAANKSNHRYQELQKQLANAKDVEVVTDESGSRSWWPWASHSKTSKKISTGEREALHKLVQQREEAMEQERQRLENVEHRREQLQRALEDTKDRLKRANIAKKQKQKEVDKVLKQIQAAEQPYVDEEAEAARTVKAAKDLLVQQHEDANNLTDLLTLFNCLGSCARAMRAGMIQFDGQVQNMGELLSNGVRTLESTFTGKLEPFLTCLREEDIDTLEDFRCESKEEFEEEFLPVLKEYAEENGIIWTCRLDCRLRKIAMYKGEKEDEATLKGLTSLREFFHGMCQGVSRSCNQLSLESYEESADNLRAIKQ